MKQKMLHACLMEHDVYLLSEKQASCNLSHSLLLRTIVCIFVLLRDLFIYVFIYLSIQMKGSFNNVEYDWTTLRSIEPRGGKLPTFILVAQYICSLEKSTTFYFLTNVSNDPLALQRFSEIVSDLTSGPVETKNKI